MNNVKLLVEQIWSLDPAEDIIKAFELSYILFGLEELADTEEQKVLCRDTVKLLERLEKNVFMGLDLYDAYFIYKSHERLDVQKTIIFRKNNGEKIPFKLVTLWKKFNKLYYGLLDTMIKSSLLDRHDINLGGNTKYLEEETDGSKLQLH